jgi:FdhD protein
VGAAAVVTKSGIDQIEQRTAKRVVTTGCGQGTIFGALMDSLDEIHLPGYARVKQSAITQLVDTIRTHSSIYKKAGSVHACALFNADATLM